MEINKKENGGKKEKETLKKKTCSNLFKDCQVSNMRSNRDVDDVRCIRDLVPCVVLGPRWHLTHQWAYFGEEGNRGH